MAMTTLREILEPIVGAESLHAAEAQTYSWPDGERYHGQDGCCATGTIWRVLAGDTCFYDNAYPIPADFVNDLHLPFYVGQPQTKALWHIIFANDRGQLATPGSLTALLDSEVAR